MTGHVLLPNNVAGPAHPRTAGIVPLAAAAAQWSRAGGCGMPGVAMKSDIYIYKVYIYIYIYMVVQAHFKFLSHSTQHILHALK